MSYRAINGRVIDTRTGEARASARTAGGRDLRRFHEALMEADEQRRRLAAERDQPPDPHRSEPRA